MRLPWRSGYQKLNLEVEPEAESALAYQLLQQSDADIISTVESVLQARPHLRKELNKPFSHQEARNRSYDGINGMSNGKSVRDLKRFTGDEPIDMTPTPRVLPELTKLPGKGNEPIVQFSCSHYFVSESENSVEVGVMRIGDLASQSQVAYSTFDISAIAGKAYEDTQGLLQFQPGEAWNYFKIRVHGNEEWDTTLVFGVKMVSEGTLGAKLGRSLWSTHIHVINDDAFPTNKYTDEIHNRSEQDMPRVGLLIEYLKLQWNHPGIRKGSQKLILVGQIQNIFFIIKLFMNMYLLKSVLLVVEGEEEMAAKKMHLVVIASMTLIPFAISHIMDYIKFDWKVGGMSRTLLQKAILRKYLTCDSSQKAELKDGVLVMGIARDASHLVNSGYMGFIALMNTLGNLGFLCLFQVLAPVVFGVPPRPVSFVPMVVFPVVLSFVMVFRNKKTTDLIIQRNDQEADIVGEVVETTKDYQLIIDFDCRYKCMESFSQEIIEFNAADVDKLKVLVNNAHFAPWLLFIFLAGYTYTGGCEVIRGDIQLAQYLTNVAVFTQMGAAYGNLLEICVEIQTSFPALLRITKLLNVLSDDNLRMTWTRYKCDTSFNLVKQLMADYQASSSDLPCRTDSAASLDDGDAGGNFVPIDMLPIALIRDLCVTHVHTTHWEGTPNPNDIPHKLEFRGCVELKQGRLISVIGPQSEGKSTLLRVLGGSLLPDYEAISCGQVFVPCHLRVIHVPPEACFFRGCLYDNIAYGVRPGDIDGDKSRVKAIFRLLGLPGNVINLLEEDSTHFSNWFEVLSVSQRHLLSIARTLVANPQVICIHKPTDKYSEEKGKEVLSVLKLFVSGGGLEQNEEAISKRKPRPRTCIMTNANLFAKDYADDIVFVSRQGVRMLNKEDVRIDYL